jgi:phosphatidylserine/phosphatidylglycerophosphate/cardiolipin synthase-like enzyme
MSHPLRALGRSALAGLAEALAAGRIGAPITRAALTPHVPDEQLDVVSAALAEMEGDGMEPRHVARAVHLLVEERDAGQRMSDRVQLVWSPPDLDTVDARDTSVVVQELFRQARSSVLISTYALDEKKKAEALFGELAERMDADPTLAVRVFANIQRKYLDETPSVALIREFATHIRDEVWPGKRLPEVFYDPRSLETEGHKRAVLHAKAVVIDERWTLLTSANFTEAAHARNIEAGVVIDDANLAERVTQQFDRFVESGVLRRMNR